MSTNRTPPDFDEFLAEVKNVKSRHHHWRLGQAAFNTLYWMRPDLSERIRGTVLDPFYDDSLPASFCDWLKENW